MPLSALSFMTMLLSISLIYVPDVMGEVPSRKPYTWRPRFPTSGPTKLIPVTPVARPIAPVIASPVNEPPIVLITAPTNVRPVIIIVKGPTRTPSVLPPSRLPTFSPSLEPSRPTRTPTREPSRPTLKPTASPSQPTNRPVPTTSSPTYNPTVPIPLRSSKRGLVVTPISGNAVQINCAWYYDYKPVNYWYNVQFPLPYIPMIKDPIPPEQ